MLSVFQQNCVVDYMIAVVFCQPHLQPTKCFCIFLLDFTQCLSVFNTLMPSWSLPWNFMFKLLGVDSESGPSFHLSSYFHLVPPPKPLDVFPILQSLKQNVAQIGSEISSGMAQYFITISIAIWVGERASTLIGTWHCIQAISDRMLASYTFLVHCRIPFRISVTMLC